MKYSWFPLGIAGAALLSFVATGGGKAGADGLPTPNTLVYSGTLVEAGAPVTGSRFILVSLWRDEISTLPQDKLCESSTAVSTTVELGRFKVELPVECTASVRLNPNVWIQVMIGAPPALPRTKIAAVPFALEAERVPWSGVYGITEDSEFPGRPVHTSPTTGMRSSLNGGFCGYSFPVTGVVTDGPRTGWAAVKTICEATCASPLAHICTTAEIVRTVSAGGTIPPGDGRLGDMHPNGNILSCMGFSSTTTGTATMPPNQPMSSMGWREYVEYPLSSGVATQDCATQVPLACCK